MRKEKRNVWILTILLCTGVAGTANAQEVPEKATKQNAAAVVLLDEGTSRSQGVRNLMGSLKSMLYKKGFTPKTRSEAHQPERRTQILGLLSKAEAQYSRTLTPQNLRRLSFAVDELYEQFRGSAGAMEGGDFSRLLRLRGQLLVDRGELQFAAAVYSFFFDINPGVDLRVLAPASQESRDLAQKVLGSLQRRRTGTVLVRDVEPGTQIWVDGVFAGEADGRPRPLPEGIHWYRLIRDGHYIKGGLFNVQVGQVHSVRGQLKALPGQAAIVEQKKAIVDKIKTGEALPSGTAMKLRDALGVDVLIALRQVVKGNARHLHIWAVRSNGTTWEHTAAWPKAVRWSEWTAKTFRPVFANQR